MDKDIDVQFLCKDCARYNICEYYHRRKKASYICKYFHLSETPKTLQFAKWVATEIFDDMWEYNKDAFAEIACRKLAKLGIVREKGDEWELVDPEESEDKE